METFVIIMIILASIFAIKWSKQTHEILDFWTDDDPPRAIMKTVDFIPEPVYNSNVRMGKDYSGYILGAAALAPVIGGMLIIPLSTVLTPIVTAIFS